MVPGCDSADSPPGANADARIVLARLLELGVREVDGPQILSAWIDRSDAVAVVYVDLRQPDRLYGLRRSFPPHCRDDDPGSTGEEMWMTMVEPIEIERSLDGAPWNDTSAPTNAQVLASFRKFLERVLHDGVHVWIGGGWELNPQGQPGDGGHMTYPSVSVNDPAFWLHHCNVDRLWDLWQRHQAQRSARSVSWSPMS